MTTPPPIAPLAPVDVPTNHLLHFLMGLMTCGGWWLVWPLIHIGNTRANAARRRAYQRAVARYQRALWERENMPGQPARPTWTPSGQSAGPRWEPTEPGYGDVMHGYRPAAELMARGPAHQDYQEMARQRRAAAQPRPAGVPPSQDGPVAAPPPASSDS